jgi:hypothetical protein
MKFKTPPPYHRALASRPEQVVKLFFFCCLKTALRKGEDQHGKSFHGMVAEKLCLLVSVDTGRGRETFLKMV